MSKPDPFNTAPPLPVNPHEAPPELRFRNPDADPRTGNQEARARADQPAKPGEATKESKS